MGNDKVVSLAAPAEVPIRSRIFFGPARGS